MTRSDLANPPTEANPTAIDPDLIVRLVEALEALAEAPRRGELELKCFTPAEAAEFLGVSENWVSEAIRDGRIPRTFVGRFPRLLARHIREIQDSGELKPNQYAA